MSKVVDIFFVLETQAFGRTSIPGTLLSSVVMGFFKYVSIYRVEPVVEQNALPPSSKSVIEVFKDLEFVVKFWMVKAEKSGTFIAALLSSPNFASSFNLSLEYKASTEFIEARKYSGSSYASTARRIT